MAMRQLKNDPRVRIANAYRGQRRVPRRPKHPFQLRVKPFQIQPFLVAPVLPGETLKNMVHQSRTVTKPLKHSLIGWWCEYYYFYVRLRDIEWRYQIDFVEQMVTSPETFDIAGLRSEIGDSSSPDYYSAPGGTNWAKACLATILPYYFRDEGEPWDIAMHSGKPLAQIATRNWMDSLTFDDDKRSVERDVNMDLNDDGDITVQESLDAYGHWQALRDAGLEKLDYEDWLRTFGVSVPEKNEKSDRLFKPELLRYQRDWAFPTNTVEPSNGQPSSAVSWISAFRADKDRMFKEPGFIVGLQVVKPKVYIKDQKGMLAGFMDQLENWLPALSTEQYERGFKGFAANAGPLANELGMGPGYEGYWVDMRDLLLYGDQFLNFAPDSAASTLSIFIDDKGSRNRYPVPGEIDSLFASGDADKTIIQTDGVTDFIIMGRQRDSTPGRDTI